jgi:D-3-phosphoglycerate dehydrogenase
MVGKISHALGGADLNIKHMVNESRGEVAYTLMDLDAAIPESVENAICDIDGVLSVRRL